MPDKCPDCGGMVFRHKGEFGNYWKCEGCKKNFKDVSGKPLLLSPKCPKCGAAMRYIDRKKDGTKITPFFSCTNYPNCNGTLDKHGNLPRDEKR
jgi:DNA topoisomerase-3